MRHKKEFMMMRQHNDVKQMMEKQAGDVMLQVHKFAKSRKTTNIAPLPTLVADQTGVGTNRGSCLGVERRSEGRQWAAAASKLGRRRPPYVVCVWAESRSLKKYQLERFRSHTPFTVLCEKETYV